MHNIYSYRQVQGRPSLYSCVISDFYQDTSSRWQTRTHRLVCFCHPSLCFLRGPGCVAEWEETCRSLTVLMPHSQAFPGRSDTHKQAHSMAEDMLGTDVITDLPGNNRPVVIVPFVMFHHVEIWTSQAHQMDCEIKCVLWWINTACYDVVLSVFVYMPPAADLWCEHAQDEKKGFR